MASFDTADPSDPAHYSPSQTALLLLDFHNAHLPMAGDTSQGALSIAAELRKWAKEQGMVVIHALIDTSGSVPPTVKGIKRLESVVAAVNASGKEEAAVLHEGGTTDEHTFLRAPGYVSALRSPGLLEFLRSNGTKSLILTGLSTSGCVLRTAVPATDEDFIVSIISDGCADPREGVHEFLIEKILPSRAYVQTSEEFRRKYLRARNA